MPSPDSGPPRPADAALRAEAEKWVVRRDRGFTAREAADFERWLAADPRNAAALDAAANAWSTLDAIPSWLGQPIVDQSARGSTWGWPAWGGMAAAAALVLFIVNGWRPGSPVREHGADPSTVAAQAKTVPQTKVLTDGTRVRLNVGAEVVEAFSANERRVRLIRGEAYFIVTPNPARPFAVQAGEITVRAIGTAFNVCWQPRSVDVLVTEGKVEVDAVTSATQPRSPAIPVPVVAAGQRAVVDITAHPHGPQIVVSEVNQSDIAQALAWHEPLRNLAGATLAQLAAEFEWQTGRRVVIADSSLRELQIGGRFRSDDLDGLIQLLAENYGISAEHTGDGTVVLRKARSPR